MKIKLLLAALLMVAAGIAQATTVSMVAPASYPTTCYGTNSGTIYNPLPGATVPVDMRDAPGALLCGYTMANASVITSVHKSFGFFFAGVPANSQEFLYVVPPQPITVPSGAGTSTCVAKVAATASTTITVNKNGSAVGTCVFGASSATGVFTWSSATSWNGTSDVLEIVGPGTADATLASIGVILNPTTTTP